VYDFHLIKVILTGIYGKTVLWNNLCHGTLSLFITSLFSLQTILHLFLLYFDAIEEIFLFPHFISDFYYCCHDKNVYNLN
jgi:hypothetical protein